MFVVGVIKYLIWLFLLVIVIVCLLRYFGLVLIVKVFGNKVECFICCYKIKVMIGIIIVVVGLWLIFS